MEFSSFKPTVVLWLNTVGLPQGDALTMRHGEQKAWALRGTESPKDCLSKQIRKVLSMEYRWGWGRRSGQPTLSKGHIRVRPKCLFRGRGRPTSIPNSTVDWSIPRRQKLA